MNRISKPRMPLAVIQAGRWLCLPVAFIAGPIFAADRIERPRRLTLRVVEPPVYHVQHDPSLSDHHTHPGNHQAARNNLGMIEEPNARPASTPTKSPIAAFPDSPRFGLAPLETPSPWSAESTDQQLSSNSNSHQPSLRSVVSDPVLHNPISAPVSSGPNDAWSPEDRLAALPLVRQAPLAFTDEHEESVLAAPLPTPENAAIAPPALSSDANNHRQDGIESYIPLPAPEPTVDVTPRHATASDRWSFGFEPINQLSATTTIGTAQTGVDVQPHDVPENAMPIPESVIGNQWQGGPTCHIPSALNEPSAHQPLYFEDVNLERYGSLGHKRLQPFISGTRFCFDAVSLPYQMVTQPPQLKHRYPHAFQAGRFAHRERTNHPWDRHAALVQTATILGAIAILP